MGEGNRGRSFRLYNSLVAPCDHAGFMNDAASTEQHNRNNAAISEKKSSRPDDSDGFHEAADPQEQN